MPHQIDSSSHDRSLCVLVSQAARHLAKDRSAHVIYTSSREPAATATISTGSVLSANLQARCQSSSVRHNARGLHSGATSSTDPERELCRPSKARTPLRLSLSTSRPLSVSKPKLERRKASSARSFGVPFGPSQPLAL
ncbi:hypothetical protein CFC21_080822 [Triticum aestivum]|uniref:Uncharacterized protein n=2 Tax=Triticum aestivum TaxID=4565 RepID=A0A9R1I3X1_WHEAT|nr:hypothetical protein CFC21_080822 [Triticum aestivum]